jgi:competence transcription factor ComK
LGRDNIWLSITFVSEIRRIENRITLLGFISFPNSTLSFN